MKRLLLLACLATVAQADTLYHDDGSFTEVPRSWVIEIHPPGFNNQAFDYATNLFGKQGDRWPAYDYLCRDYSPTVIACEYPVESNPPVYDFYDANKDGIVDYGSQEGCVYDPRSPVANREFHCEDL